MEKDLSMYPFIGIVRCKKCGEISEMGVSYIVKDMMTNGNLLTNVGHICPLRKDNTEKIYIDIISLRDNPDYDISNDNDAIK